MTPVLENAVLGSDLDCRNYDLMNVGMIDPVPDNLVAIDDIRLTGGRVPAPGSVTNDSVNATAAIDQNKLNLNGVVPFNWLASGFGVDDYTRAASGVAAEFLSHKGAPNGYAALGSDGKIQVSHLTPGAALGSISSITIFVAHIQPVPPPLSVHPQTITSSGSFTFQWANPPAPAWFGSDGTYDTQHQEFIYPFFVTRPFNNEFFQLPASKFTSGVFNRALIPIAKPMGTHVTAPDTRVGMVPDPGLNGHPRSYLGRDMHYHDFLVNDPALRYQPTVPDVTIVLDWWEIHEPTTDDPSLVKAHITIRSMLKGSFLFYRSTHQGDTPAAFQEAHHDDTPDDAHISIETNDFDIVEAYAARQGYNDSKIEQWTVITPISDLNLPPFFLI